MHLAYDVPVTLYGITLVHGANRRIHQFHRLQNPGNYKTLTHPQRSSGHKHCHDVIQCHRPQQHPCRPFRDPCEHKGGDDSSPHEVALLQEQRERDKKQPSGANDLWHRNGDTGSGIRAVCRVASKKKVAKKQSV